MRTYQEIKSDILQYMGPYGWERGHKSVEELLEILKSTVPNSLFYQQINEEFKEWEEYSSRVKTIYPASSGTFTDESEILPSGYQKRAI